ncbi:hypothetical protein KI387_044712 [Taxus chinensis]|uniref:1-acyl-sn-glycerol-3-phosphate acyltransferase delta n=1 Tax=Taxus chinensis TaxID=29808 RepID=A0AA38FT30_TAXCH|nr:hypothetical protein KI387_044712 [Taxus chinensis]
MLTLSVQLHFNGCVAPTLNNVLLFKLPITKFKLNFISMPKEGISVYDRRKTVVQKPPQAVMMDPWAPSIESQSIASQLFAVSLFPYLGFLYYITKSKSAPTLTLFGFYFLLAFVGATIPAGIYAKIHYGTSLSNVDWLHGSAESLLTLTNLFIVLGLRRALREEESKKITSGVDDNKRLVEKERSSL